MKTMNIERPKQPITINNMYLVDNSLAYLWLVRQALDRGEKPTMKMYDEVLDIAAIRTGRVGDCAKRCLDILRSNYGLGYNSKGRWSDDSCWSNGWQY